MKMRILLAAAAVSALAVASPANATGYGGGCDSAFWCDPGDPGGNGSGDYSWSVDYDNDIDTSLKTSAEFHKRTGILGGALLLGLITVDSAAVAIHDPKQILEGNDIRTDSDNRVSDVDVRGSGNVGSNVAAGTLNQQMNSAAIAISEDADTRAYGGWSEASTTSLQALTDLDYDPVARAHGGADNRVGSVTVAGSGNIGSNVAAGAFNQQSNLMTLAVATNSTMAEANAGLVQLADSIQVTLLNGDNSIGSVAVSGSGNIGSNVASGVGNQQLNSLTIASSAGGGGI